MIEQEIYKRVVSSVIYYSSEGYLGLPMLLQFIHIGNKQECEGAKSGEQMECRTSWNTATADE